MKIMQWDIETGKKLKSLDGHNGDVAALSLKPDENQESLLKHMRLQSCCGVR